MSVTEEWVLDIQAICLCKTRVVATFKRQFVGVFELDGTCVRKFGRMGLGPGCFFGIAGVAAAEDGTLFVSDSGRVQVFQREAFIRSFRRSDKHARGSLCVHDTRLYATRNLPWAGVEVFTDQGKFLGYLDVRCPLDVAANHEEIYVGQDVEDENRRCISVWSAHDFTPLRVLESPATWELSVPMSGFALNGSGQLVVWKVTDSLVFTMTPDGRVDRRRRCCAYAVMCSSSCLCILHDRRDRGWRLTRIPWKEGTLHVGPAESVSV